MSESQSSAPRTKYFAALEQPELPAELMRRVEDYRKFLSSSGLMDRVKKSYNAYYGFSGKGNFNSSEIGRGGVQGELALIKVNHYRNLCQHLLNLTCAQRPAMDCRAANTDHESEAQVILGNGLLDFYMREKRLEKHLKNATEHSLVLLEGWVELEWDTQAGQAYGVDPDTQAPVYEGDIRYAVHPPQYIIRDWTRMDSDHDWVIVETSKNKFDLAAKYPELAEKIVALGPDKDRESTRLRKIGSSSEDSVEIPIYKFMHRKTEALPNGRLVIFLNSEVVLFDGPMPYDNMPNGLPVYRITPSEFIGTSFGYSSTMDLLSIQEAIDALYSVVITNQTTFGVQTIVAPKGHDIEYTQLAGGLSLIEYDKMLGKPEALELCKTPVEIFNFITQLEKVMEIIAGINSVVRGDPAASLKSGSALALVASQAIQFSSGLQQSWAALLEDVGLATLKMLQQFANTKRVASIVGENDGQYLAEFKGDDLDKVNRVVVDVANPLSKTPAGRLEQANNLLNAQRVDAEQYLQVVETGSVKPMTEGGTSKLMCVRSENKALREGKPVRAVFTDPHRLHITEHSTVIDNPEIRATQPELIQRVGNHIMEHLQLLQTTDPNILMMLGEQPIAPPMPPGPPQGGPQGSPAPGPSAPPPPHGQPPTGAPETKIAEPPVNGNLPSMPGLPTNPLSGNKFNPQTGGL